MPHEDIMNAIEIYGNEVVPKVKKHFKDKENKKKLFSFKWKKMEEIGWKIKVLSLKYLLTFIWRLV